MSTWFARNLTLNANMVTDIFVGFSLVSALIFLVSVPLNSLVLLVFYRNKHLCNPPNVFLISVAASDLFCSVSTLPFYVVANAYEKWIYGDVGCTLIAFVACLSGLASLMHLAAASYERYVALVHPLNSQKFTVRYAARISLAMWLYALFWSLMPLCGWSGFEQEGIGTSCSVRWKSRRMLDLSYNICLLLACYVLPVSVMCFSYVKCCREIKTGAKCAKELWGRSSSFTRKTFETERRMARLFGVMTLAFLGAWTPYAVVSFIAMIGGPHVISDVAASTPAFLAKTSACLSPIIYVFLYKRLRRQIYSLLRKARRVTRSKSRDLPGG